MQDLERQETIIFERDWIRANRQEYDCSAWKDTKPDIRLHPADTHLHLATNRCPVGASMLDLAQNRGARHE